MKTILALIAAFFSPAIIFPIPAGQQGADPVGANGLIGLMKNVNQYAESMASVATAGTNVTLIPAQLLSGLVQLNAGNAGSFTVTLPSTGAIIAALGNTIPLDGSYSEQIEFLNNSGALATLVPGDGGTTIVGAPVIGSNVSRQYIMQVLGSSTISLSNKGFKFL